MIRSNVANAVIDRLREKISIAELRKRDLINYSKKLEKLRASGEITEETYLYQSQKEIDGRTIKEWIDYYDSYISYCRGEIKKKKAKGRSKRVLFFFFFFAVILTLSWFIYQNGPSIVGFAVDEGGDSGGEETVSAPAESSDAGTGEQAEAVVSTEETQPIETQETVPAESIETEQPAGEKPAEEPPTEEQPAEEPVNETTTESTTNETTEAPSNETTAPLANETMSEELQKNETAIEEPTINKTVIEEPNQTIVNETNITIANQTIIEVNKTANITVTTTQSRAILGQPVKWQKNVSLDQVGVVKVRVPGESENITVLKLNEVAPEKKEEPASEIVETSSNKTKNKEVQNETITKEVKKEAEFTITGHVVQNGDGEGNWLARVLRAIANFFKRVFGAITGRAIQETNVGDEIEIEINDNATEYSVVYETPAPYAIEEDINGGKRVQVVGPENVHYENVLAFTNIPENLQITNPSRVRIRWLENNTFVPVDSISDTDGNGIYDYIEWTVPHMSNQTFDIIIITSAEELDSNKNFIRDIYDYVKEKDDNWTTINDSHYIRVTFKEKLDNTRDITLYARSNSSNATIEVYYYNTSTKILTFPVIQEEKFYKEYLTNLNSSYDTFDLKVIGNVEFDYIVDPVLRSLYGWDLNYSGSTTASNKKDHIEDVAVDSNDNIYAVGWGDELVWSGVSKEDIWIKKFWPNGTEIVTGWNKTINNDLSNQTDKAFGVAVDSNDNVYIVGSTLNTTTLLDWWIKQYNSAGTENSSWHYYFDGGQSLDDEAYGIAIDSNDNVYVVGYGTELVLPGGSQKDIWIKKFWPNASEETGSWNLMINDLSNGDEGALDVAIDSDDNVTVVGYGNTITGGANSDDWWVMKWDPSAVAYPVTSPCAAGGQSNDWCFDGGVGGADRAKTIVIDQSVAPNDTIYIGGYFNVSTTRDWATIRLFHNLTNDSAFNGRVVDYGGNDEASDMVLNSQGDLYVVGTIQNGSSGAQMWHIEYINSTQGNLIDAKNYTDVGGTAEALGVGLDSMDDIYVFGYGTNMTTTSGTGSGQDWWLNKLEGYDINASSIVFVNQTNANDTITNGGYAEVNVSITEKNLNIVIYDWNNTNYTIYNDSLILMLNFDNFTTNLAESLTTAVDLSSYGNNATISGATSVSTGKYGNAFSFDGGSDIASVGSLDGPASDLSGDFTFEAWIKRDNTSSTDMIFSKANPATFNTDDKQFWINATGNLRFGVNGLTNVTSSRTIGTDWTHVLVTHDNSADTLSLYINGTLDVSNTTYTIPADPADSTFHIGEGYNTHFFNGTIDEIYFWNRTMNAAEVSQRYMTNIQKHKIDKWQFFVNQTKNSTTSLDDYTDYTYRVYTTDVNGNTNVSETRYLTVNSYGLNSCSSIGSPGVYPLISDINDNTLGENCIIISSANVTIDCNGHSITSTTNHSGVYSNQINTTVRDCNISMGTGLGGIGIEFDSGADNSSAINNTLSNQYNGLYSTGATNLTVENNTVDYTTAASIHLNSANDNSTIRNNTVRHGGGDSIYYRLSSGGIIEDNYIFNISGSGITFNAANDGNVFVINNQIINTTGGNGIGLSAVYNISIINNTIEQEVNQRGILINTNDLGNTTIQGTNITGSSTLYGIEIRGGENYTLDNVYISGFNRGVYSRGGNSSKIINSTIINNTDNILCYNGVGNIIVQDTNLNSSAAGDAVQFFSGGNGCSNWSFINTTYDLADENIPSGYSHQLYRKWYFDAYVNDSGGTALENANVTAYNSSTDAQFSVLSAASGNIARQIITDYMNNGTSRYYYNNYTVNATLAGYTTDSNIYNLTEEQNINDYFTLVAGAPTVSSVSVIAATDPYESGVRNITFQFNVTDTDGVANVNGSTAAANFTFAGETDRTNTSCIWITNYTSVDTAEFECSVGMWYYDASGSWSINATIKDNDGNYAENSTESFTYNILTAMVMSPTSLNWSSINILSTDVGSDDNPITLNNTGNDENLTIEITSYDLSGLTDSSKTIPVTFMSIGVAADGCIATSPLNATAVPVDGAELDRGTGASGQEQLYFCLSSVPPAATPQAYNATFPWDITVVTLVMISVRKRKKKKKPGKKDYEGLVDAVGIILDNLRRKHSLRNLEAIELLIQRIRKQSVGAEDELVNSIDFILDEIRAEGLTETQIIDLFVDRLGKKYKISKRILRKKKGIDADSISISVFSTELGGLEALVRYMKENLSMDYSEIAEELNRDYRTIWTAYNKAVKKNKEISIEKDSITIPLEIFKNRKLTVFEAIVTHLRKLGMRYSEMEELLNRNQRNLWTINSRAEKK